MNSARALTREWLRHPTLYYSTIATCVGGGYECAIIMCVISEYAEYEYACFSGSWQVGKAKIQPVVQLCLCKSYSVLTACIDSSLQNQAYPVFSQANPGHAHKGLRLYHLPRQFHPKGTLLCGHRLSQTPLHGLNESNSTQRFLL